MSASRREFLMTSGAALLAPGIVQGTLARVGLALERRLAVVNERPPGF